MFQQFLLREDVVVSKGLIFNYFTLGGCSALEITDF